MPFKPSKPRNESHSGQAENHGHAPRRSASPENERKTEKHNRVQHESARRAPSGKPPFAGKNISRPERPVKAPDNKNATAPLATDGSDENGTRLNKAIAATGLCSRRKADELILAGRVRVNGAPEPNPARHVLPVDSIEVDGRVLAAPQAFTYLMLNKPIQVVCTASDPEGRPTVLDCLAPKDRTLRLYPVGRLDFFSEGLLLLTNDGQLAQRLTHPRHHQPKTYEVLVRGTAPDSALKIMRRGMRLAEGEEVLPVDVTAEAAGPDTLLRMILRQGLNRQIRRMCRDLDLTILRLRRVAQGTLRLGDLAVGKTRPLSEEEVNRLREAAGLPPRE